MNNPDRNTVSRLRTLPNIGKAMAANTPFFHHESTKF
jgi:hypothetical protein